MPASAVTSQDPNKIAQTNPFTEFIKRSAGKFGALYNDFEEDTRNKAMKVIKNTPEVKVDWTFIFIIIAGVLIILSWIMLIIIIRKLHISLLVGDRSQAECGKNYMEIETARNKIYTDYVKQYSNSLKFIKTLIGVILSLCLVSFTILIFKHFFAIKGLCADTLKPDGRRMYWLIRLPILFIICIATYIAYMNETYKYNVENKYLNKVTQISVKFTTAVTIAFFLSLLVLAIFIIWINGHLLNRSSTVYIWLLMILPITMIFAFFINIYVDKINNEFIVPYSNTTNEINNAINFLRNINCGQCVVGDKDSKSAEPIPVSKWMNIMLARNIKRMNPGEENGDPAMLLQDMANPQTAEYLKTLYAYIEHALGKELSELPDNVEAINQARMYIRQRMRSLRHNNDAMLSPIKSLIAGVFFSTVLVISFFIFMIYHSFYINYPTATTVTTGILTFIFIFIFVSYSWYMGSIRYR